MAATWRVAAEASEGVSVAAIRGAYHIAQWLDVAGPPARPD
jgi:hypothetical protein